MFLQGPLNYTGVRAPTPPNLIFKNRIPTATDNQNFQIGDIWIYFPQPPTPARAFILLSLADHVANWSEFAAGTGGGDVTQLTGDDSVPVYPTALGDINIVGGSNINTDSVAANALTINLDNTVSISGSFTADGNILSTAGSISTTNGIIVAGNTAVSTSGANVSLLKSRAGGPIVSGDKIGSVIFSAFDSTSNPVTASAIQVVSSGTIGAGRVASDLEFYTHSDSNVATTQRMIINSAGQVAINAPDSGTALAVAGDIISTTGNISATVGTVNTVDNNIIVGNTSANSSTTLFFATVASRAGGVINSGDILGGIEFKGFDGTNYIPGAQIQSTTSGTIGTNQIPSNLAFFTHPNSAAVLPTSRMTISSAGNVSVSTPDSGDPLSANGNIVSQNGTFESNNTSSSPSGSTGVSVFASRSGGAIISGDALGALEFYGNDGTNNIIGAAIQSISGGTIAANRIPADLEFYTHPDAASSSATLRLTITRNGNLTVAAPDSGNALTVSGSVLGSTLYATGDLGGAASSIGFTNVAHVSGVSTGVGSIKMNSANNATNQGFIKIYSGVTAYYIPVWTTDSP